MNTINSMNVNSNLNDPKMYKSSEIEKDKILSSASHKSLNEKTVRTDRITLGTDVNEKVTYSLEDIKNKSTNSTAASSSS